MRAVALLIAAACASAGCDGVFGLVHIGNATSDVDAMSDGPAVCKKIVHDEDHDGIDDVCDPCPFDANNGDDPDLDGISGSCDPDPNTGNQRLLFWGFGADDPQFQLTDGTVTGDAFHTAANRGAAAAVWQGNLTDSILVMASVRVSAIDQTQSQFVDVGFVFDTPTPTGDVEIDGIYCILGMNGSTDYAGTWKRERSLGRADVDLATPVASSFGPLGLGVMRAAYNRTGAASVACSFVDTTRTQAVATGGGTTLPAPGKLALWSANAETDFEYVFVVSRP